MSSFPSLTPRNPRAAEERLGRLILRSLLVGAVLGIVAKLLASFIPTLQQPLVWFSTTVLDPIGQVFLRLLFFVVVPLVFSSLTLGVLQLGNLSNLGRLAGRTFALFTVNMAVAVGLGLVLMNSVSPGSQIDRATQEELLRTFAPAAQTQAASAPAAINALSIIDMFMPRNVLKAIVEFNVLPLILFSLLLGVAGTTLASARRVHMASALDLISELMSRIVHFALRLAPLAVPCMIFSAITKFGVDLIKALALFVLVTLAGMLIHLFGTMSLLLKLFSRRSPGQFFRAVRIILVTAFSTSSSNATLPTSIQVSRDVLGVSPATAGFVLPLGATMNMSGTALYEGCVVLFIAQVYGIQLGLGQQITLVLLAVLSAVAVAGIPGGSLPLIVGLLATFHIPPEGIAIILGVDRLLDMCRTVLNVTADVVTACIVDEHTGQAAPGSESG